MPTQEIASVSAESRYLTPLRVYANGDPTISYLELGAKNKIDINHQKIQELELGVDRIDLSHENTQIKIVSALRLLTFREQHVLVQFWSPQVVGKHQFLTTIDQPFGLGVMDERLLTYRRETDHNYFVTDNDHVEEEHSPVARVYRRGLPEWTPDVTNYLPKHLPQQECVIRCNLHGYLALPVFDMSMHLCVGVLELLTSSKYTSYAYEVQQLCNALQTVGLRTQQAFDCSILNVSQVFCNSDRSQKKKKKKKLTSSCFNRCFRMTINRFTYSPACHQRDEIKLIDNLRVNCHFSP
ncbi:hypothetical protein HanXRQr2_Chr17g0784101 [Helianthus annuus]|uniref:NIN-like protein n=1 Tax=Helianthus annuus TaxID=4232 RepID=A0A9K3DFH6_HELAN|nr:protein NLP3 isoform X2 [Helianthus annuus]KAF5753798.1 hypothetical protein HanXRQr2_Chr17g0784101 [Helianthus annuus]